MSTLPSEGDGTPLVMTLIAPIKPMARSAIHELVKAVMRAAAATLRRRGPDFEAAAARVDALDSSYCRKLLERQGRFKGGP